MFLALYTLYALTQSLILLWIARHEQYSPLRGVFYIVLAPTMTFALLVILIIGILIYILALLGIINISKSRL